MKQHRWLFLICCCIIIIFLMSAYKVHINSDFVLTQRNRIRQDKLDRGDSSESGESSNYQNEEFNHNQRKESPSNQSKASSTVQSEQSSSNQSDQSSSNPNQASSKNQSEKSFSKQTPETSTQKSYDCKILHFSEDPLPVTALFSYPGSGNTWLRHLIHQATGIYTGSIYNDEDLKEAGFLGEDVINGSVIMVKTHSPYKVTDTHFKRAIVLIRNPAGALRSVITYFKTSSHIGHVPEHYFKTKEWEKFASETAYQWGSTNLSWIMFPGPLLFVQYEELIQNLQSELRRILDFLGQNVSDKDMQCVLNNNEGQHHRSAVNFNFDLYRPNVINYLNKIHTLIVNMYQDRK